MEGEVSSSCPKCLVAGSRDSKLAIIQTEGIINALQERFPQLSCKIETMKTFGDKVLDKALPKAMGYALYVLVTGDGLPRRVSVMAISVKGTIGDKSLFTKDLEIALDQGKVDFLVHSLKDLPTLLPPGMAIGAIFSRDDPYDAVLFHPKYKKGTQLKDLAEGSVIGTSSLRRIAQLKRAYPHLIFESIRGNLNTRLRKLEEDEKYDAIVLAVAGVQRMQWADKIGQILQKEDCLYAVSQGALAVEVKTDDVINFNLYSSLTDAETLLCCVAERMFLRKLEGGCSVPIGVWCTYQKHNLELTGAVFSVDGSKCIKKTIDSKIEIPSKKSNEFIVTKSMVVVNSALEESVLAAEGVGAKLASLLIMDGAVELLKEARVQINTTQENLRIPKSE